MSAAEPAFVLDAARVLAWALLPPPASRGERTSVVVEGVSMDTDTISRLAVVESLADGTVHLLHCNADWETVAAGRHRDAASAKAAGTLAYERVPPQWQDFRALTPDEEREIATTRAFLRELAAQDGAG